jgi:transcriptional regulator with XRE-family HTH domain
MMGRRLRRIRRARGKSLDVVAGLAGISKSYLSMLETADRPLDSLKLIAALANALEIAPSELIRIPLAAPGDGNTDSAIEAVRRTLDGIDVGHPAGQVLPVGVLRERVARIEQQNRECQFADVARELPGLIADLHTTLDQGSDHAELIALAVYLHVHITRMWLVSAGAPADLHRRVVFLARTLARQDGRPTTLGMAAHGVVGVLLRGGAFEPAQAELDSLSPPLVTRDTAGLQCSLLASRALAALLLGRPDDADAPLEEAAGLASRFGEYPADPLGFAFGPTSVEFRRMELALERAEPDEVVRIAEDVDPRLSPFPSRRVYYWTRYGGALSQLRGRGEDAVRALRTAETIFPTRMYRDPMARDVLTTLVEKPPAGRAGQELRGLAHRAGLSV